MSRFDKFDKPFRILPTFDERKGLELFNLASKLDTHELLQYSLVNQIPLDYVNNEGECLIHEVINIDGRKASEHAKLNVIKFLVQNRVNPDKSNKNNQTPLHLACVQQLPVIVEYLLELGVNPNFQDNMGNTPLHYLLTGFIKTIDSTNEVMDFVPPPKKQNLGLIEKTIEIKQLLWDYINKQQGLPMLESLSKTIDNILKMDKDIVDKQKETNNLILKLASNTTSGDNSTEIKDQIQITEHTIKNKIMKLFDGLPDLPNFEIHNKEASSWSPLKSPSSLSLISNGNIKTVIKKDMESIRNDLIKMNIDFKTILQIDPQNYRTNGFEELQIQLINISKNETKYPSPLNSEPNFANGTNRISDLIFKNPTDASTATILFRDDFFDDFNKEIRHSLALDNASDIIDWDKLKYIGGPRKMDVYFTKGVTTPWDEFSKLITHINDGWNENQVVLYMLSGLINTENIVLISDDSFNFIDQIDVFATSGHNNASGKTINFNTDIIGNAIYSPYAADYCFFIILAHTAIFFPEKFDDIKLITPNTTMPLGFTNNTFAKKWFHIYKNENPKLGNWIYSMYCDGRCKYSLTNLEGAIHFNLLMLISGLANNKTNRIKSIINSYKPHLIDHLINTTATATATVPINFVKTIITMLNFDIDNTFITSIDTITIKSDIAGLNISNELKNLAKLSYDWIEYLEKGTKFDTSAKSPEYELYRKYGKIGDDPEDVFIKIIIGLNEQEENQLLKQTLIDLIYRIKNMNTKDGTTLNSSINDFAKLGTYQLIKDKPPTDASNKLVPFNTELTINQVPSLYGTLNYNIDLDLNDKAHAHAHAHLFISHILGLHYQGMIAPVQFKLDDPIEIIITTSTKGTTTSTNGNFYLSDTANHSLSGDQLDQGQLPIILNYLSVDPKSQLSANSKYTYYNIASNDNNLLYIPTTSSYANMILYKIHYYQEKIQSIINTSINTSSDSVNIIINSMINGNTTKLADLYIKKYPEIVACSNILLDWIDSWNELANKNSSNQIFNRLLPIAQLQAQPINTYDYIKLARGLNKINSNYYLYYYLYQPGKIISLSRFNYYQIPIDFPTKSFYYNSQPLVNPLVNITSGDDPKQISTSPPESTDHLDVAANKKLRMLNNGYINDFKLGNYSAILDDYTKLKLPIGGEQSNKDFIINKSSPLPPSLYNALNDFYKFTLIELVKKILNQIKFNKQTNTTEQNIWEKSELIIKSTGIAVESYDLATYAFITKIIQELVKEKITTDISNEIIKKYNEFIKGVNTTIKPSLSLILPIKQIRIDLTGINIDKDIKDKKQVSNLYSLVIKPPKSPIEPFILYPNDLTNINKLRSKYGVVINPNIVEIMMKSGASPYSSNADGYTTIYPIIKNYNYKLVQSLKSKVRIDFRSFNESPLKFIQQENLNNLNKILNSVDINNIKIKDLLENIDGYLYNDIKSMITANELFGNNILVYLSESFNISTYLTLQYLSNSLKLASNIDFNQVDLDNIIGLINDSDIIETNLDKNYLEEKIADLSIPDEMEVIIINELIDDKQNELTLIKTQIDELNKKDDELLKKDTTLHTKINIKKSSLYTYLDSKIKNLNTEIQTLKTLIIKQTNITITPKKIDDLVSRYQYYNSGTNSWDKIGLMAKAWSKLLETNLKSNYNLIPIYVFAKQKELISNLNLNNLGELMKIEKVMGHWALIAENYFDNKKFTDINPMIKFIDKLLNYITKMVIGNGIELMMRRILMTWLLNSSIIENHDYDNINEIIDFILETELTGRSDASGAETTMLKELYEVVCPKLVKNSAEIFENKADEQAHSIQNTKEILLNYFQLLDLTMWGNKIPNEIKDIFRVQVANYFDTITSKSILLWYVNVENILKFFINNHRCLKTLLELC